MIAQLSGIISQKLDDSLILDVNGVGYEIYVPASHLISLPQDQGIQLYIYTHVKEESLELFGFPSLQERSLFKILISVSGIGPRLGLTMLNSMDAISLVETIRMGHSKMLTKIPGIGSKTAERIVLELKNKKIIQQFHLDNKPKEQPTQKLLKTNDKSKTIEKTEPKDLANAGGIFDDAINALVSLGYRDSDALSAVRSVMAEETHELPQVIKLALKQLSV